jgi:hypothetical protein
MGDANAALKEPPYLTPVLFEASGYLFHFWVWGVEQWFSTLCSLAFAPLRRVFRWTGQAG